MNPSVEHLQGLVEVLNTKIVKELIEIYFSQIEEINDRYKVLMTKYDEEEIVLLSHKMKSSSRNIGATELADLFAQVEKNPRVLNEEIYLKMHQLFLEYQDSIKDMKL